MTQNTPTMLQEVAAAVDILSTELPMGEAALTIFAPQAAAVLAPFIGLFQAAARGVDYIAADTGKPFLEALTDALDHNTPGKPNAPALSPSAPAPLSTTSGSGE
jgi:hypothetical protein